MFLRIFTSIAFILSLSISSVNAQALKVQHDLVVAKDGSGDFKYIQDAINAVRVYLPKSITIKIKKGKYVEKLDIPSTLTNIKFVGEDKDSTIISYNDYSGKGKMETFDSFTLRVMGNNLSFENLTIELISCKHPVQTLSRQASGFYLLLKRFDF